MTQSSRSKSSPSAAVVPKGNGGPACENDRMSHAAGRRSPLTIVREWADALVIAFLLAMFIRTFVVELFKIPSGSMIPTLVGTSVDYAGNPREFVLEWDVSDPPDGRKDLIIDRLRHRYPRYQVFFRGENGEFVESKEFDSLRLPVKARQTARVRNDRIVVNKFIYWLRRPRRGEIVVFRVPANIYEPDKPIYIKRLVGLPGEQVEIREPHLYINGKLVDWPEVFRRIHYVRRFAIAGMASDDSRPSYIRAHVERTGYHSYEYFDGARVPEGHYFVLGDNSKSSRDSRDWGAVPESNLRGMAIFRYWPPSAMGFLK